jgi:hypothetical protein
MQWCRGSGARPARRPECVRNGTKLKWCFQNLAKALCIIDPAGRHPFINPLFTVNCIFVSKNYPICRYCTWRPSLFFFKHQSDAFILPLPSQPVNLGEEQLRGMDIPADSVFTMDGYFQWLCLKTNRCDKPRDASLTPGPYFMGYPWTPAGALLLCTPGAAIPEMALRLFQGWPSVRGCPMGVLLPPWIPHAVQDWTRR